MSGAACSVVFTPAAAKSLERLPKKAREAIVARIEGLAADPRPHGSTKLSGRDDQYRIRVGDFRVIYSIDDAGRVVIIITLGQRVSVYDR